MFLKRQNVLEPFVRAVTVGSSLCCAVNLPANPRKVHDSLALSSAMFRQESSPTAWHAWKPRGLPVNIIHIKMQVFIFLYANEVGGCAPFVYAWSLEVKAL